MVPRRRRNPAEARRTANPARRVPTAAPVDDEAACIYRGALCVDLFRAMAAVLAVVAGVAALETAHVDAAEVVAPTVAAAVSQL